MDGNDIPVCLSCDDGYTSDMGAQSADECYDEPLTPPPTAAPTPHVGEFELEMSASVSGVSADTFNSDPAYTDAFASAIEATLFDPYNPDNVFEVSEVMAADATTRRKLRVLAESDAAVISWVVTASGDTVNMDDTNAQMFSSVNSGDFNSNLAQYASIAGASDLQTASMEGLESAEVLPEPAPKPKEEEAAKKSDSKVALIAGIAGGAAVLLLAGGYILWTRGAADSKVVPTNDPDVRKSSQISVDTH